MVTCPKCNAQLAGVKAFCPECGIRLMVVAAPTVDTTAERARAAASPLMTTARRATSVWIRQPLRGPWLVALLVLAGGFALHMLNAHTHSVSYVLAHEPTYVAMSEFDPAGFKELHDKSLDAERRGIIKDEDQVFALVAPILAGSLQRAILNAPDHMLVRVTQWRYVVLTHALSKQMYEDCAMMLTGGAQSPKLSSILPENERKGSAKLNTDLFEAAARTPSPYKADPKRAQRLASEIDQKLALDGTPGLQMIFATPTVLSPRQLCTAGTRFYEELLKQSTSDMAFFFKAMSAD